MKYATPSTHRLLDVAADLDALLHVRPRHLRDVDEARDLLAGVGGELGEGGHHLVVQQRIPEEEKVGGSLFGIGMGFISDFTRNLGTITQSNNFFSYIPGLRQGDLWLGLHRVPDVVVAHLNLLLGAADGDAGVSPLLRLASVAPVGLETFEFRQCQGRQGSNTTQFSYHHKQEGNGPIEAYEQHNLLCLLSPHVLLCPSPYLTSYPKYHRRTPQAPSALTHPSNHSPWTPSHIVVSVSVCQIKRYLCLLTLTPNSNSKLLK